MWHDILSHSSNFQKFFSLMGFSSSTCQDLTLYSSWIYKEGQITKWTISVLADSGCSYWEIKRNIFSFGYTDTYVLSSEAAGIETA